jgi:hypothetical protein
LIGNNHAASGFAYRQMAGAGARNGQISFCSIETTHRNAMHEPAPASHAKGGMVSKTQLEFELCS